MKWGVFALVLSFNAVWVQEGKNESWPIVLYSTAMEYYFYLLKFSRADLPAKLITQVLMWNN